MNNLISEKLDHYIETYMRRAYELAMKSPDPSSQNGAIIINTDGQILAEGYNCMPDGVQMTEERLTNRDLKLLYIEHAERKAIYQCIRNGHQTLGQIMICPWFSCSDCARAIVEAGISLVVGHTERMALKAERWATIIEHGNNIIDEGNTKRRYWSGKIGNNVSIRSSGEIWYP